MSLENFGWGPFFSQHIDIDETQLVVGRVASQHRGLYRVFTERGELVCNISGRLRTEAAAASQLPAVESGLYFSLVNLRAALSIAYCHADHSFHGARQARRIKSR